MIWLLIGLAVLAAAYLTYRSRRYDPRVDNPVGSDQLEQMLEDVGVEITSSRAPESTLLSEVIDADETIEYAIDGKMGGKNAIVCLTDDRVIIAASTVGSMGSERRVIPYDWMNGLQKDYDRGGTLRIDLDEETIEITHLPRSKFEDFEAEFRRRFEAEA